MRCLQKLPPEQREVIVLKIWHEHTFEEIGDLLATSPNTVAGRWRYGMEKLRACLRTEEVDMAFVKDKETGGQGDGGTVALSPCRPVPVSAF